MKNYLANSIGHFDICGSDAPRLHDFYGGVFGWTLDLKGPGYALAKTPEGSPDGAILEAEQASLTIGIVVTDIENTISEALRLGGNILMPLVDNGWVKKAVLTDPAGNKITIIQS